MKEFLSLYAIDLPRFDNFLGESLADILWYYVEHGVEESLYLPYIPIPGTDRSIHSYLAMPGSGVGVLLWDESLHQTKPIVLTERPSKIDSFLSLKARDYLAMEDSGTFKGFLNALSLCPTIEFVKAVSVEERAWWLASFLDYLKSNSTDNRDIHLRILDLLQKTLRGYDFERKEADNKSNLADLEFVVIPAREDDLRMGVWSENDVRFFIDYLHRLVERDHPQFGTPPEFRTASDYLAESDWNEWVYDIIVQFLEIEKHNFTKPYVVSFIDVE